MRLHSPQNSTSRCAIATSCCSTADHAPAYGQDDPDEPEMGLVREPLDRVLAGHEALPRPPRSTATEHS